MHLNAIIPLWVGLAVRITQGSSSKRTKPWNVLGAVCTSSRPFSLVAAAAGGSTPRALRCTVRLASSSTRWVVGLLGERGDDRFGPSAGVLLLIYSRGTMVPRIR